MEEDADEDGCAPSAGAGLLRLLRPLDASLMLQVVEPGTSVSSIDGRRLRDAME
jgi:hypothetical protein